MKWGGILMTIELQKQFWDSIDHVIRNGVRSYENQINNEEINLKKGQIEIDNECIDTWFGESQFDEPRLLIKMLNARIETELILECTIADCRTIAHYYQGLGILVEILNRKGNNCVKSQEDTRFVQSCEIYRESFNRTNQLIAILDSELNLRYANRTLLDYMDLTLDEIIGVPYWELSLWKHSPELQNKILFSLERMHLGHEVRFETTHQKKDGGLRDIDFVVKPIFDHNGEIELMMAMGYDVTETKLAESALKRTEREMKLFFDYSVNGYFINRLNESIYLDSENLNTIFDYVQRHEKIVTYNNAILQHIDIPAITLENTQLFDLLHISRGESLALWREMVEEGSVDYQADIEIAGVRKILNCIFVPILEDGNRYSGSFGIIKDQTEEVLNERKMVYLATKDSLTGTNNRRHFLHSAWEAMHALTEKSDVHPAVIMIDIDDFKNVNDTYGHDIGDKVLIEMTGCCEYILKEKGIYGRMGGEEFAAFINNENGEGLEVAEKIRYEIEQLIVKTEIDELKFTVSIGYTEMERGHTMEEALKRADKALYQAKRTGKNKVISRLID
jgi:diguanylate cyclase (GGDEF)-like protein/PAS domain S-box-containing protein